MSQISMFRRRLLALASRLMGKGRTTPRYGHVEFSTLNVFNEPTTDRWTFRLDDRVTDFAAAWQAAVHAFSNDRQAFTDAVHGRLVLSPDDFVADYPHILAAHGLTLTTPPDGPTVVVTDDAFVTSADWRCIYECADGLLCGQPLDHDARHDKTCHRHPQDVTS